MLNIEKIKSLLEAQNLTQEQLADLIGVSESMVSHIFRGFKEPSVKVLKRIADVFDVKVDDLIKEEK